MDQAERKPQRTKGPKVKKKVIWIIILNQMKKTPVGGIVMPMITWRKISITEM